MAYANYISVIKKTGGEQQFANPWPEPIMVTPFPQPVTGLQMDMGPNPGACDVRKVC